jgi:preprotein translocase subunit SecF
MVIPFFKYRKFYYVFSSILLFSAILSLLVLKLNFGIEFKGGSILELEYLEKRPEVKEIEGKLSALNLGETMIQAIGDKGVILRTKEVNEETHQKILENLRSLGELKEVQFESIGPTISKELKEKSTLIVTFSIFVIVLYIAFAFKNLSPIVPVWKCGVVVLFCLFHDVVLPLGFLALLGKFLGVQFSIPVVIALLTIVGYSINNVVVVYDRFRETLQKFPTKPLPQAIDQSISQTLTRQINTSLTTLFPLFSIFFLVGEDLKYFSLTLILGILFGTYSSIFLALIILGNWQTISKREKTKK